MSEGNNVAEFPDRSTRIWRIVADALREHYASQGWDGDDIEEMLVTVGPIYLAGRDFEPAAGSTPDQIWTAVSQWMNNFADRFTIAIASRELELIAIRKGKI